MVGGLTHKKTSIFRLRLICCRGRVRTSTRQLAEAQSSVVDPGRNNIAIKTALC